MQVLASKASQFSKGRSNLRLDLFETTKDPDALFLTQLVELAAENQLLQLLGERPAVDCRLQHSESPQRNHLADESCLGNQFKDRARPGGSGGVVEYFRPERGWVRRDFWISEPDTTNNRMAIRSAMVPLAALKTATRVLFTTDSRSLVDGMTQFVQSDANK